MDVPRRTGWAEVGVTKIDLALWVPLFPPEGITEMLHNMHDNPNRFSWGERNVSVLLTIKEFQRQVIRERKRSVRRASPFGILSIRLQGPSRTPTVLRRTAKLLIESVRETDEKGILGNYEIGIMLVDTPEMGCRVAMQRVSDLLESKGISAELKLHTFESSQFEDDHDDPPSFSTLTSEDRLDEPSDVPVQSLMYMSPYSSRQVKRAFDVLGASVGLILSIPIICVAALAVRLSSSGPIFFCQRREGFAGQPFTIFKLRTMVVGAEESQSGLRHLSERDGPAFKIRKDPRVTWIGNILRATCIDELPQLWNVLKGEMSLVGPRPLPYLESRSCKSWHRRRLDVRPGLTGQWQVAKHKAETFDDWMRMDLDYIDLRSPWKDMVLLLRTITVPLFGRGSD